MYDSSPGGINKRQMERMARHDDVELQALMRRHPPLLALSEIIDMMEMMADCQLMKKRYQEIMKERERKIEAGELDPNTVTGPYSLTRMNKMSSWFAKMRDIIAIDDMSGLTLDVKYNLFIATIKRNY